MADEHSEPNRIFASSYFSATILTFVLGSSGIVLSIMPILVPNSSNHTSFAPEIAEIVSVGISTICLSIASWYLVYYKWTCEVEAGTLQSLAANVKYCLKESSEKYIIFMLITFGLGSIVCSVMIFIEKTSTTRDVILNAFEIVSISSQIVFFCYYSGYAPKANLSPMYDYAIACMIGLQIWTWVSKVMKTLWPEESHSRKYDGLALAYEIFEPFDVEFTTIAIGSLINIWHSKKASVESGDPDTAPTVNLPYHNLLESLERGGVIITGASYLGGRKSFLIVTILAVVYLIINMFAVEGQPLYNGLLNIYIVRGSGLLFFIPLTITLLMSFFKIRSAEETNYTSFLNGGEYVLLFTACGESNFYVLRGIAGFGCLISGCKLSNVTDMIDINNHTLDNVWISSSSTSEVETYELDEYLISLTLSYAVMFYIQVWLQARFLIIVKRKQISFKWIQSILIYIAVFNFAKWLLDAVLFGLKINDELSVMPVIDAFFGGEITRMIVAIFLPVLILFRFHSAVIAIEIYNELEKNQNL